MVTWMRIRCQCGVLLAVPAPPGFALILFVICYLHIRSVVLWYHVNSTSNACEETIQAKLLYNPAHTPAPINCFM